MPPDRAAPPAPARPSKKPPLAERVARLTPQQMRVLTMIRQGKLNKQIAHELQVGDSTVKPMSPRSCASSKSSAAPRS